MRILSEEMKVSGHDRVQMVNQVNVFLHIRKGFSSQSDANGKSKEA